MSFGRKRHLFALSAAALGGAAVLPMATGFAFESGTPGLEQDDGELVAAAGLDADTVEPFSPGEIAEPVIELDEEATPAAEAEQRAAVDETVDEDLICLAKTVRHEAGNQSRQGQLAVAQVVMNRVNSPRFPNSICDVIMQRGQFFNVHAYNPSRTTPQWQSAMEVAIDARNGVSAPVVGDAVFFHARYVSPAFFRSRPRVAQIEDHIFYR